MLEENYSFKSSSFIISSWEVNGDKLLCLDSLSIFEFSLYTCRSKLAINFFNPSFSLSNDSYFVILLTSSFSFKFRDNRQVSN